MKIGSVDAQSAQALPQIHHPHNYKPGNAGHSWNDSPNHYRSTVSIMGIIYQCRIILIPTHRLRIIFGVGIPKTYPNIYESLVLGLWRCHIIIVILAIIIITIIITIYHLYRYNYHHVQSSPQYYNNNQYKNTRYIYNHQYS